MKINWSKVTVLTLCILTISIPTTSEAMTSGEYTTKINHLFSQIENLQKQISDLQKEYLGQPPTGGSMLRFTSEMKEGMTNDQIRLLQRLLATDPAIYADGRQTGYFGPLTREAISNFQKRYEIQDELGFVGPVTLKYLNAILEEMGVTSSIPTSALSTNGLTSKIKIKLSGSNNGSNPGSSKEQICLNGNTLEIPSVAVSVLIAHNSKASRGVCGNTDTSAGDVREFEVEITDDRSYITVIFDNGKKDTFVSPFFDEKDIIEDLADRYDMDEEDVADIVDFSDFSEVDEITAIVDEEEEETKVIVEYTSGDEKEFTIDEIDEDDVIEAVADELDMDEDDVENIIKFKDSERDNNEIEEIEVTVEDGRAYVTVEYEDDDDEEFNFRINEDDDKDDIEEDIIEEVADELDMDEDDVEDLIDIEFED